LRIEQGSYCAAARVAASGAGFAWLWPMNLLVAIGGLFSAMLPARWWPSIDRYLPATESALAASVLTIIAGGILGIGGSIDFGQQQARVVPKAVHSSSRPGKARDNRKAPTVQGVPAFSVFGFILTPPGIFAAYLTLSGAGRALSAQFGEGFGDPILTAADHGIVALHHKLGLEHSRFVRLIHEGPNVPDMIVRGVHIGMDDADLVIVSARVKRGWDRGTIVRSGEQWYRVGVIDERIMQGYLRTLYPLNELHDHGAIRRLVNYPIPDKYASAAHREIEDGG
jgi:hypothetical protein